MGRKTPYTSLFRTGCDIGEELVVVGVFFIVVDVLCEIEVFEMLGMLLIAGVERVRTRNLCRRSGKEGNASSCSRFESMNVIYTKI